MKTKDQKQPKQSQERKQRWKYHTLCFQSVLQSYSNHNSMVQSHKQTYRSQNRTEGAKTNPHLHGPLIYEKRGKSRQQGKTDSSINGVGKYGQPDHFFYFIPQFQVYSKGTQPNTGLLSHIIYKSNLEMDYRFKYKT